MDIIYMNNLLVQFHGPTLLQSLKLLKHLPLYFSLTLTWKQLQTAIHLLYPPAPYFHSVVEHSWNKSYYLSDFIFVITYPQWTLQQCCAVFLFI